MVGILNLLAISSCHRPARTAPAPNGGPDRADADLTERDRPMQRPPRAFDTTASLLQQTHALVSARVSGIRYAYDDCAGPITVVSLDQVQTLAGGAHAGQLQLTVFGGPLPNGKWVHASELPQFADGARYVIFLRNTDWRFSPVLGPHAYRVAEVGGREVLISQEGFGVTGLTAQGVVTDTRQLSEPVGARHAGYVRPRDTDAPRPQRMVSAVVEQGLVDDASPRPPATQASAATIAYGPTPEQIRLSRRHAVPELLAGADGEAVARTLSVEQFARQVTSFAEREHIELGGYFTTRPSGPCWRYTPTQPEARTARRSLR